MIFLFEHKHILLRSSRVYFCYFQPALSKKCAIILLYSSNFQPCVLVCLLSVFQPFLNDCQAKILDHDNVNYLKKILGELAMVLDQVEAELEKRKLEYQGILESLLSSIINASQHVTTMSFFFMNCPLPCRSKV